MERIVHWSILRNSERSSISKDETKIKTLLLKLGHFAWKELQNDNLLLDEVCQLTGCC